MTDQGSLFSIVGDIKRIADKYEDMVVGWTKSLSSAHELMFAQADEIDRLRRENSELKRQIDNAVALMVDHGRDISDAVIDKWTAEERAARAERMIQFTRRNN